MTSAPESVPALKPGVLRTPAAPAADRILPTVANYPPSLGSLLNGVIGLQSALDYCVDVGSTAQTCFLCGCLL